MDLLHCADYELFGGRRFELLYFYPKPDKPQDDTETPVISSPGASEILTAIALGFFLCDRSSKNHKPISQSARDELYWQEKYHKDRYYGDEEDL